MNQLAEPNPTPRNRIGFVCLTLGEPSETWLWRQAIGLRRYELCVLTWKYRNRGSFPLGDVEWHEMAFDPTPYEGPRRWIHRIQSTGTRNFFGTVGRERRWLIDIATQRRLAGFLCHFGWSALRMAPVGIATGIPIVAHFHGVDLTASLKNHWYRWSLRQSIRDFAAFVTVNDRQRDTLVDLGAKKEAIHVIPCGVPVEQFSPINAPVSETPRLLAVGRFVEKKAPLTTLRAFDRCITKGARANLVMVGDGPLLSKAKAFVSARGLQGHVSFTGAIGNEQVLELMHKSDVFLQHSVTAANGDMEGWPVSIAEAVACGMPVIATRHAGIPLQIAHGKTGYLVKEHGEVEMSKYMMDLLANPQTRREMSAAARWLALERFDHRVQMEKLEAVIADSIG